MRLARAAPSRLLRMSVRGARAALDKASVNPALVKDDVLFFRNLVD